MKEPISDRVVIVTIISTILMIFLIAFLITSSNGVYDQQIEWRDVNNLSQDNFNM